MASASLYLLYLLFSFLLFCCGYRDACWRWRDWRKVMSSWILLTNETMPKVISNEMAVTVSIREGELTAIVGTNGAGKSSFAKVICGFERQQKGSLRFAGESLDTLSIASFKLLYLSPRCISPPKAIKRSVLECLFRLLKLEADIGGQCQ